MRPPPAPCPTAPPKKNNAPNATSDVTTVESTPLGKSSAAGAAGIGADSAESPRFGPGGERVYDEAVGAAGSGPAGWAGAGAAAPVPADALAATAAAAVAAVHAAAVVGGGGGAPNAPAPDALPNGAPNPPAPSALAPGALPNGALPGGDGDAGSSKAPLSSRVWRVVLNEGDIAMELWGQSKKKASRLRKVRL